MGFKRVVAQRNQRPRLLTNSAVAVHVVVREVGLPVEVQVRTDLQHVWAELSEKLADAFGSQLKYGGGPKEMSSSDGCNTCCQGLRWCGLTGCVPWR